MTIIVVYVRYCDSGTTTYTWIIFVAAGAYLKPGYYYTLSGSRLNIKPLSYQYMESHVKDKTVSQTVLSLTWKSPYWERRSLYWDGVQMVMKLSRAYRWGIWQYCCPNSWQIRPYSCLVYSMKHGIHEFTFSIPMEMGQVVDILPRGKRPGPV